MFERKTPPGFNRPKEKKEVIDVKSGMNVWPTLMPLRMGMTLVQVIDPLFDKFAIPGSTVSICCVATQNDDCLKQRHCVIEDLQKMGAWFGWTLALFSP
jgi:hypothetical protein